MGTRFGRYELRRLLATGGMAEVHVAVDVATGETAVVKRILPELANRPDFVAMFAEEARLMGCLPPHPHVVRLLDAGQVDGTWFQALRYVDGPDLATVLGWGARLGEAMPLALATWIVARVADGLHHVHEVRDPRSGHRLDAVHRDVSPGNVLLSRQGDVCVADLGIAHFAGSAVRTETGVLKGKAAYMSPEQASGDAVDARSDVFAVGVVLHELLTGQRLFAGSHPLAIIHRITTGPIPPPSAFNPHVDLALDDLVMKALERRKERRFQSAADLAAALDAWRHARGEVVDATLCGQWVERLLLAVPSTVVDAPTAMSSTSSMSSMSSTSSTSSKWPPLSAVSVLQASSSETVTAPAAPPPGVVVGRRVSPARRWAAVAAMAVLSVGGGRLLWSASDAGTVVVTEPAEPDLVAAVEARPVDGAPPARTTAPSVQHRAKPVKRSSSSSSSSSTASKGMGRLSVRTTPPTVVSAAADVIDATPFVGKPLAAGVQRLTLRNPALGIDDEITVKVPRDRNLALIATWTKVDNAWVLSTKSTREYR